MDEMDEMNTITLFFGAHGSKPDTHDGRPETRSLNPHRYPRGFTVNFLSIAGYANINTIVALVIVREPEEAQEKIIKEIEESGYDTKKLFTSDNAQQLNGLGTDHVALSYLVPRIFKDKIIDTQSESRFVIDDMKNEMWALGMLADIHYSDTSPPERIENPQFEKWWWFDNNIGDDRRRFNTKKRTGPSRAAGNTEDNPILSTNGLFILHTTKKEHSPFSISNIHASSDYEFANKKDGLRIITPVAIKRRNLLRKINYTSYWKKWIEAFDFRAVPDQDVLEIGSIEEAVFIVKQIYYAFHSENATDDPTDPDGVAEIEEDIYVNEGEKVEKPVAKCESSAQSLSLSQPIIQKLKELILPQAYKATELNKLSEAANITVQTQRADLRRAGDAADELEREIKERAQQIQTRRIAKLIYAMKEQLAVAESELDIIRTQLTAAKEDSAELESQLVQLQREIVAGVTELISHLISLEDTGVKAAIKNIIMRNKLKNILKFGIFHKRLSLSQIILFFRSLGYDIINIVDPTCSVLKPPRTLETDIHSQDTGGSQEGIDIKTKRNPRDNWVDELNGLAVPDEGDGTKRDKRSATAVSQNGGTKRKRSYSRKRRTRRKKRTRRRTRR